MIYNTCAKEESKVSNLGFKIAKMKTLIVQQLLVRKMWALWKPWNEIQVWKYATVCVYLLYSTLSSKHPASSSSVSCAYARQVSALSYSPRWRGVMYAFAMKRTKSSKNFICSKSILYHVCAPNISISTMELDTTNSCFAAFLHLPVLIFFQGSVVHIHVCFKLILMLKHTSGAGIVLQCTCATNQSQQACVQSHPKATVLPQRHLYYHT